VTTTRGLRRSRRAQAHRSRRIWWLPGVILSMVVASGLGLTVHASWAGSRATPAPAPSSVIGTIPMGSLSAPGPSAQVLPTPVATGSPPAPGSRPPTNSSAVNVYAGTGPGMFSPTVRGIPERVYVPDEASGMVTVIDPRTFRILYRFAAGASPEHVTPDWNLRRLYVESAYGNELTIVDARSGRPVGHISAPGPYNLYFSPDGRLAIVVRDASLANSEYGGQQQLYFYNRSTWKLIKALRIPWAGADHLDFSADGSYLILSTEYAGWIVKVDLLHLDVVNALDVGGFPTDVRLSPDGRLFFVANQGLNGVSIVDPVAMRQVGFIKTGRGAHGLAISRDARQMYVTNRLAGTLSVIDFATRSVVATWRIGGSPDMIAVSPDGTLLWISNRYSGTVSVVDSRSGRVIRVIRVGGRPHGLAYFPEPGSISLGHNGNYR
jgi:YVTN family beta-propeller protein